MVRPRKTQNDLPRCVYFKHGAYWYVKNGKWTKLGSNKAAALAEYGRIVGVPKGGLPDLVDKAMPDILAKVSRESARRYKTAASKLKHVFAEFSPEQIRP